jgi:hypothetical protein
MSNTTGPQLEGKISIDTSELSKASAPLGNLASEMLSHLKSMDKSLSTLTSNMGNVSKAYQNTGRVAKAAGDAEAAAAQKTSEMMDRKANAISRAADRVAGLEQRIRKSNASQETQQALVSRLRAELDNYAESVRTGSMRASEMDNANTALASGMSHVSRELKDAAQNTGENERQQVANIKALGQVEVSYDRVSNAIAQSAMADEDKLRLTRELSQASIQARQALEQYGSGSREAAEAQTAFRQTAARAGIEVRNVNAAARAGDLATWKQQMRDLTSSVQLALGPLSGVASRISALAALFKNNAAAIAGLIAGVTGLTVGFVKSAQAAVEAETQMLSLEGIVGSLGESARFTAQDLFDLGTNVGMSLLTSAKEARAAAGALATFGNIGKSQFEGILTAAQGLSQMVGGTLQSNVIRIGRLLEDPTANFGLLERSAIKFDEATREQIKTLINQGRRFEANELIMKSFSAAQETARKSAEGLAGQIDSAKETLNLLFEGLFTTGGASEEAAAQLTRFNDTLREIVEGDAGKIIGEIFTGAVSVLGTTINVAAENLKLFGAVLLAIAGSSIPVFVGWLGRKALALKNSTAAILIQDAALGRLTLTQIRATAATKGLTTAMTMMPLFRIAAAVAAVATAFLLLNRNTKEVGTTIDQEVEAWQRKIDTFTLIPKSQREDIKDFQNNLVAQTREVEKQLAKQEKAIEESDLRRRILVSRKTVTQGPMLPSTVMDTQLTKELRQELAELEFAAELAAMKIDTLKLAGQQATDQAAFLDAEIEKNGFSMRSLADRAEELRQQYMRDEVQLENLQAHYKELTENKETLINSTQAETEAARATIAVYDQLLPRIQKEIDAKKRSMEEDRKRSRAFAALSRSMRESKSETKSLQETLANPFGSAGLDKLEIEKQLERYADQVTQLRGDNELAAMAEKIGLVFDGAAPSVSALTDAVREHMREVLTKNQALEKEIESTEQARRIRDGSLTGIAAIEKKYEDMTRAIEHATAAQKAEAEQAMATSKARELADLNRTLAATKRFTPLTEVEQLEEEMRLREEIIKNAFNNEEAAYATHLAAMRAEGERAQAFASFAMQAQEASQLVGGAMAAMQASGREQTREHQAMALVSASISQGVAIAKAWETGPFLGPALATMMAFQVGAQIAHIKKQSYADGGFVSGKGTATSDSIPAWLSDGEFVMQASAVKALGIKNLNAMNEGRVPRFASGGPMNKVRIPMNTGGGGGSKHTTNIYNLAPNVEVEQNVTEDSFGNTQTDFYIRETIKAQLATGEFDSVMGGRFGVKPQGRRR